MPLWYWVFSYKKNTTEYRTSFHFLCLLWRILLFLAFKIRNFILNHFIFYWCYYKVFHYIFYIMVVCICVSCFCMLIFLYVKMKVVIIYHVFFIWPHKAFYIYIILSDNSDDFTFFQLLNCIGDKVRPELS